MEQILTMTVLPPTLNDIIKSARGNRFGNAALKKSWTRRIEAAVVAQKVQAMPGQVYLEFVWRVKNRRRDQDNISAAQKFILDGLVGSGILEDDNLSIVQTPVVHHVLISNHDGFSIFIRHHDDWIHRLQTRNINQPPTDNRVFETPVGGDRTSDHPKKGKTSSGRKSQPRLRYRKRTSRPKTSTAKRKIIPRRTTAKQH